MTTPLTEHRVGRLLLSLPAEMRRAGQEHVLCSSVYLREVEWTSPNGYKKVWSDWLQKLSGRRAPPGVREIILEQREIAPRCQGVLAYDSEHDRNIRTWFALLDAGTHGVWMECARELAAPEQALSRLYVVARSYRTLEKRGPLLPEGWFYLERGAVALPPLRDPLRGEYATVLFEGPPLDPAHQLCVRIAPGATAESGLMGRLQRARALGLAGGSTVTILRTGTRRVAGFEGEELVIQVETEGSERLAWAWSYPGQGGTPHVPCVELSMHALGEAREDKVRLWENTLESMRHLLPQPPGSWLEQL
jgi:Tle cognate immunity protein 4 C-terminal domain